MTHKQSYTKVMLNKRRYSSEIAVFNMSTVILHNKIQRRQDHDTTRWNYCHWNVV